MPQRLDPHLLLAAYRSGIFPMADPDDGGRVSWYAPDPRAILPLDAFHIPRSLARTVRRGTFEITSDQEFEDVMRRCAESRPGRKSTWISEELIAAYTTLHSMGLGHSIETWRDSRLVGGLYGVAIGAAFFAESMFSRESDASKVALVHLVERLRAGGFGLLDVQMSTPHLARFGVTEIPRREYERRLTAAISQPATWHRTDP